VASTLAATGVQSRLAPIPNPPAWVHPGQAAAVHAADGSTLGWVATLHPRFVAEHGVHADAFAAHLDLHAIDAARDDQPRFTAFSEFPPVVEDIALVLSDDVAGGEVLRAARDAGGELLESVEVFDRYVGAPIEDGHHSLALRLVFRSPERTLTDADTAEVRASIVAALGEQFGAQLRG
jgi:phenylalanyl-tRNA synthetase beta chain